MASTATSEAAEVRRRGRHRLIGAIVIAILLVVFVPMILDSEPRTPHEAPALDIPPKDKAPPLPPPAPAQTATPAKPAPASTKPGTGAPSEPAPVAPKTAEFGKPTTAAVAPAKVATQATPRLEGFAVQVGAFKDEEKLKQAREKLSAASISHYTERHPTSSGEVIRLRAGPFPTRQAADGALATIKLNGLDGQVVPLP